MAYEVVNSECTHVGKIVRVTVDEITLPNGKTTYRETVIRGASAGAVLPIMPDGKLLFVRQYRHAYAEMMLEIPAGILEDGETPEEGVLRELEEETGFKGGKVEYLCEMYPTVGFCDERIHMYIASDLTEGVQHLDADEFVEIETYTLEEALSMITNGQIKDGKTILAIFAYKSRL
ncbi:NUDIX hydrolase [Chakrabartyella piscis]|uniref:NUDIX hydrolase n=1 Tax=Chakrabartyella piscis TaxID=2918914 RepID=UPI0029584BB8|nr:NUDIX hydrolase [Chakrabartyella piscis]